MTSKKSIWDKFKSLFSKKQKALPEGNTSIPEKSTDIRKPIVPKVKINYNEAVNNINTNEKGKDPKENDNLWLK